MLVACEARGMAYIAKCADLVTAHGLEARVSAAQWAPTPRQDAYHDDIFMIFLVRSEGCLSGPGPVQGSTYTPCG